MAFCWVTEGTPKSAINSPLTLTLSQTPAALQHGPRQDTSQGGDDHQNAEGQVPMPLQAQGPSGEGLQHYSGMCDLAQHSHYQRGTMPLTAPLLK